MNHNVRKFILVCGLLLDFSGLLSAWGIWGHQHINHAAVFALPAAMRTFYFNHIDYLTEEASVPDIRKYTIGDKQEPPRHYIDLGAYGKQPFDSLPQTWEPALARYGRKTLEHYGILPWYVQQMEQKLTQAFRLKRSDEILFLSADLGHYVADATMPLHTSLNYDGQFTGQRGIHAFWESQLPELFGNSYDFRVAPAHYIPDIASEIWGIIRESHGQVDSLLGIEKRVHASFPRGQIYVRDSLGRRLTNSYGQAIHTLAYARAYHSALHGMVENQMRLAIQEVSDFWYTAWVNGGKPDLGRLDPPELTRQNLPLYHKEYQLWQQGKLWGLRSGRDD